MRSFLLAALLLTLASPVRAIEPAELPATVDIPAGPFIAGSDAAERERAYDLDTAAYGNEVTRKQRWYAAERPRHTRSTGAYAITATPITNAQYAAFVAASGHPVPDIDAATWRGFGLIHPYERARRHAWKDGAPPPGRAGHPVVLVAHADAHAYAAWLSAETGQRWRLPSEDEWVKAVRGTDGPMFPWGDSWDAARLASADTGPFDTVPAGSFPDGDGPFGLKDGAGLVYEWTATPAGGDRYIVKGGSWDDRGCGVCRPAARHGRPAGLKHILIGFRLVRERSPQDRPVDAG